MKPAGIIYTGAGSCAASACHGGPIRGGADYSDLGGFAAPTTQYQREMRAGATYLANHWCRALLPPNTGGGWGGTLIGFIFLAAMITAAYVYMRNKGITAEMLMQKLGVA